MCEGRGCRAAVDGGWGMEPVAGERRKSEEDEEDRGGGAEPGGTVPGGAGGLHPGGSGRRRGHTTLRCNLLKGAGHSIRGVSLLGEAVEGVLQNNSFCVVRDGHKW